MTSRKELEIRRYYAGALVDLYFEGSLESMQRKILDLLLGESPVDTLCNPEREERLNKQRSRGLARVLSPREDRGGDCD